MNRKSIAILINVIFWTSSLWFLVSGFSVISIEHRIVNGVETQEIIRDNSLVIKLLGAVAISFLLFYVNYYFLTTKRSLKGKGPSWKTAGLSIGLLLFAIVIFHGLLLAGLLPEQPKMQASLLYGIFSFYYAISVAYALGISWLKSEAERKNLLIEKNKAELTILRNQLQPHFLFNSLNNLLSMVDQSKDSNLAGAIARLAYLLRYIIEESKAEKVNLIKEIEFIENYASLQLLRFNPEEVEFNLNITGDAENILIEPGLFIPFIENAFKYGTEPEHESVIRVNFDVSPQAELFFSVTNSIVAAIKPEGISTGIDSVRNRLEIVYPDRFNLEISQNGEFTVKLKITLS